MFTDSTRVAQEIRKHMFLWDPLPTHIRTPRHKAMYQDPLLARTSAQWGEWALPAGCSPKGGTLSPTSSKICLWPTVAPVPGVTWEGGAAGIESLLIQANQKQDQSLVSGEGNGWLIPKERKIFQRWQPQHSILNKHIRVLQGSLQMATHLPMHESLNTDYFGLDWLSLFLLSGVSY